MVEQRSSSSSCSNNNSSSDDKPTSSSSFGNGYEIPMTFSKFVNLITSKNDDRHYLTTQDVHSNPDNSRPDLMSPLMKYLQHDFPLQPQIIGNLIPQNINLWMGGNSSSSTTTEEGISSGLHHDYHDNLYIVLKGKKKVSIV
jgi:hypothetical protein